MERTPDNANEHGESKSSSSGESRVPLHGSAGSEGLFERRTQAEPPRPPLDLLRAQVFADLGHNEPPKPKPEAPLADMPPIPEQPAAPGWNQLEQEQRLQREHAKDDDADDEESAEDDDDTAPAKPPRRWPRPIIPSPAVEGPVEYEPRHLAASEEPQPYESGISEDIESPPDVPPAPITVERRHATRAAEESVSFAPAPTEHVSSLSATEHAPKAETSKPMFAPAETTPLSAEHTTETESNISSVEDVESVRSEAEPPALDRRQYIRPPEQRTPAEYSRDVPHRWSGEQSSTEIPAALRWGSERSPAFAEYYYDRRKRAGDFILAVGLSTYLAHRLDKRMQKRNERAFKEIRSEQAAQAENQQFLTGQLAGERQRADQLERRVAESAAQQSPARRIETPFVHSSQAAEANLSRPNATPESKPPQELAEREAVQPLEHASQRHVEHSSWHNIVVDEHGHEVQGAIQYGEAFQQERRQEQVPTVSASASPLSDASQQNGFGASVGSLPGGVNPLLDLSSGQVSAGHGLPAASGSVPVDVEHRLPAHERPRGQVQSTITSPWLWLGIGLLLLAFFTAAFL
ncbi:MAG TPA: hypothetical protein VJP80_07225 [Candidatus Saccharimonadales bacterium]|nr:hypothetical protein [Candidatus Saccharimonadales bacterium]